MLASIKDLEYKKFKNPESQEPEVRVSSIDGYNLGEYDELQVTYPTATTEVFTYKLSTITIGTVTITYTATNKKDIESVIKT